MFISILFFLSSFLIFLCSISLVSTKNIMHSCIFLLGTLVGVAGLYVTMGADFVAATQIMVYVGGIVILMLFAVMLTGGKDFVSRAQALMGLIPSMGNKFTYTLGVLASIVLVFSTFNIFANLAKALPGIKEMDNENTVAAIGKLLVTDHVLAFELSSILLLGALIGAAIIARPKKV